MAPRSAIIVGLLYAGWFIKRNPLLRNGGGGVGSLRGGIRLTDPVFKQHGRNNITKFFSKRQSRILSFLTENFFFSIQCVSMDAFVYVDRFRISAQAECKERLP